MCVRFAVLEAAMLSGEGGSTRRAIAQGSYTFVAHATARAIALVVLGP